MRGHIHRRGPSWTVVYDESPRADGKRRQRTKGGFATKGDAQRFLTDTLARLGDGSYAQPSKLTLGEFLESEWLPAVAGTLRPLSLDRYRSVVKLYLARELGATRLQALSGGHLNGLYAELERRGLSVSTRRLCHAVAHRALRDAVRWGRVQRNVADMADPPAAASTRVQAWTAGELRRFLEHVRSERLFALWRLAAMTGMRRGELAGLGWLALNFENTRLSVQQQLVPTRGGATLGAPKRSRSLRTIALDAETVDALQEHRAAQLLERDFAGDSYQDHDLVFADELGGAIHPQRLTEWFGKHRRAADIPTGTLHTLRHTHATILLTAGVPVHIVAARLGDTPQTILATYAHLLPQSDELAAERAAAVIA